MKTIILLFLALTLNAVEFETAAKALKAGTDASELLQAQGDGDVESIVIPQAKILRDASRFFQAHADDDYSDEQLEQIAVIQKSLHNCRQRMTESQIRNFNSDAIAMVPVKAKEVAKK